MTKFCFKTIKFIILTLTISTFSINTTFVFGQSKDMGSILEVEVSKKINKFKISASTNLQTIYTVKLIDKFKFGLGVNYSITKRIGAELGYEYKNILDYKYTDYQFRNRYYAGVKFEIVAGRFDIGLRERWQSTSKDDSDRIKSDGSIDTYPVNPEYVWRNKLDVNYNIIKSKLTPYVSAESFYHLNSPNENGFYNFRYSIGVDYKINKRNFIDLFFYYNTAYKYGKYRMGLGFLHKI